MKRSWKILIGLVLIGLILPTAYSLRSIGVEMSPLTNYASLGTLLAAQENPQKSFYNQLFSEETLTVTKEADGVLPGSLRTILLQAAGIRHNNPFTLVKIAFDPSVKRIRVTKGNLPPVVEGLISLDCSDRIILDGSSLDPRYLGEGETPAGLTLQSSGNTVKGCQIVGFAGHGLVLSGNRNQVRENKIGSDAPKNPNAAGLSSEETLTNSGSGIYIADGASENIIESNQISGNKQDGITFSPQTGPGNRIVGNIFIENGKKGIASSESLTRTVKPVLKPITKEGDSYLISGTVADTSDIEIYMTGGSGKEGTMTIVPLFTNSRGDFSVSVKSKGFIPGDTKIVVLATSPGHNTSEFSDPAVIPAVEIRSVESTPLPSVTASPSPSAENKETNTVSNNASGTENTDSSAKPLNEKSSSALSVGVVPNSNLSNQGIFSTAPSSNAPSSLGTPSPTTIDPFLNATTLPPPATPQISPPPTVKNGGVKSGESDSLRVESVTDVVGAP